MGFPGQKYLQERVGLVPWQHKPTTLAGEGAGEGVLHLCQEGGSELLLLTSPLVNSVGFPLLGGADQSWFSRAWRRWGALPGGLSRGRDSLHCSLLGGTESRTQGLTSVRCSAHNIGRLEWVSVIFRGASRRPEASLPLEPRGQQIAAVLGPQGVALTWR